MQRDLLLSCDRHSLQVLLFGTIVFGAIILPMLPVWQGSIRLLACALLFSALPQGRVRNLLLAVVASLLVYATLTWVLALTESPGWHIVHMLMDIYGQPLDPLADGAILLTDFACVLGLGIIAVPTIRQLDRLERLFIGCLLVFWVWPQVRILGAFLDGTEATKLAQMMTGASVWATWVYFSLIGFILLRGKDEVRQALTWIATGGIVVAVVVGLQWLLGDYSYILYAPRFEDYFYRVRGTYYYHTSATLAMVLCGAVLLSLETNTPSWRYRIFAATAFVIAMALLNNTRALSLTLLFGLLVIALVGLRRRNYLVVILTIICCFLVSSNIFYLKPSSGTTLTTAVQTRAQAESSARPNNDPHGSPVDQTDDIYNKIISLVASNEDRSKLLLGSFEQLDSFAWFGSGIGVLEIPLQGDAFNGLRSTYSSHTLYMDVILMAGVPAFLAIAVAFSLAAWRSASTAFLAIEITHVYRAASLLAALLMFGIAGLFIPQERNELIGLMFLLAAIAVMKPASETKPRTTKYRRFGIYLVLILVTAVAGWTIVTSPAYVFPVVELVTRYGHEIRQNNSTVVVTEPIMKPMTEMALRLYGISQPRVTIMLDQPEQMPDVNTWILWSPKNDPEYRQLRKELGYQDYPQGSQTTSFRRPADWWIMPSAQPLIVMVYVGPRTKISVPLGELATIENPKITADQSALGISQTENPDLSAFAIRVFQLRPGAPRIFDVALSGVTDEDRLKMANIAGFKMNKSGRGEVILDMENISYGDQIELDAIIPSWPNHSTSLDFQLKTEHFGDVRFVADSNFATGVYWPADQGATLSIGDNDQLQRSIGIYRMVAFNFGDKHYTGPYSWIVEASNDGLQWQVIDRREEVIVSRMPESPAAFLLLNRGLFQYYRFRFAPSVDGAGTFSGLMEIELYPIHEH